MPEKQPFDYDEEFPDRWLHAADLGGKERTLTITAAYKDETYLPGEGKTTAHVMSFKGAKKEYLLNKTNAMVCRELWGSKSADWVGHRLILAPVPDPSGKSDDGLKILFVGADVESSTRVKQPQNKTRVIKPIPGNTPETHTEAVFSASGAEDDTGADEALAFEKGPES